MKNDKLIISAEVGSCFFAQWGLVRTELASPCMQDIRLFESTMEFYNTAINIKKNSEQKQTLLEHTSLKLLVPNIDIDQEGPGPAGPYKDPGGPGD